MGCGAALTCTTCGLALLALSTCANHSSQVCPFLALGPSEPSSFSVDLVPYQATSMIPGALPAATQGKTPTLDGGELICRGADQAFHSLSAPGGAHEYQVWKVLSSIQTAYRLRAPS